MMQRNTLSAEQTVRLPLYSPDVHQGRRPVVDKALKLNALAIFAVFGFVCAILLGAF